MVKSEITKTLQKVNNQPSEYSLGFKRLISLPNRIRKNINLTCVIKGESNDNSAKNYFNELSEQEFINWLKLA
jgi:DNA primase catalytic subunit